MANFDTYQAIDRVHARLLEKDADTYFSNAVADLRGNSYTRHTTVYLANLLTASDANRRAQGSRYLKQCAPAVVAATINFLKRFRDHVPRSTRQAVRDYLRARESDPERLDRAILRGRKAMKTLYASLHIKPSPRADAILFKNDPPPDSLSSRVKELAETTSPVEQARLIHVHRIPWAAAVGALTQLTPPVMLALIEGMTPNEVHSRLGALKARGCMDHVQIRSMVHLKLGSLRERPGQADKMPPPDLSDSGPHAIQIS